jgi:hypothetical protein
VDVLLGGGEDYWYPAGNSGVYQDQPAKDPSEKLMILLKEYKDKLKNKNKLRLNLLRGIRRKSS